MAKLKGPFLSVDAFGHIGKTFAVSHWKGTKKAIKHFKPRNPRTTLQQDNRSIMRYAVWYWQSLTDDQKWSYDQSAKSLKLKMSGYNYFLQTYIAAYKVPPPPPPPDPILDQLISWWRFNENEGNIAYDSHGPNNATLYGPTWTPGQYNSALSFNGSTDYLIVDNESNFDLEYNEAFSFEFWGYLEDLTGIVFEKRGVASPYPGWFMYFIARDAGRVQLNLHIQNHYGSTGKRILAYNIDDLNSLNAWHHYVATYSGNGSYTGIKIYFDSVLKTIVGYPGYLTCDASMLHNDPIIIGSRYETTMFYTGDLDEMRIYRKELSQEEINHNFNL